MSEEKKEAYFNLFNDVWQLFFKYKSPMGSETFWELLKSDAQAIADKYNNSPMAMSLINTVLDEIERNINKHSDNT